MEARRFGTAVVDEATGRELIRLAGSRVAVFLDDLKNWESSTVSTRNKELLHSEIETVVGHILTQSGHDTTILGINYHSVPSAAHITEQAIDCSRAIANGGVQVGRASFERLHVQAIPDFSTRSEKETKDQHDKQRNYTQRPKRRIAIRTTKARRLYGHPATIPRRRRGTQSVQAVRAVPHGTT